MLLDESSIFLSFSELEGFGLPPVEAALSGNFVIGYTGNAGAEYFSNPNFNAVPAGNIHRYTEIIINYIRLLEDNNIVIPNIFSACNEIAHQFSKKKEEESLLHFVKQIESNIETGKAHV